MDEDYDRIEREMAKQNQRLAKLIAAAKAILERAAAVIDKPHLPDELERGPVEPPAQNVAQVELGRAISTALENIRDREAVRRAVELLDKSVSDEPHDTPPGC